MTSLLTESQLELIEAQHLSWTSVELAFPKKLSGRQWKELVRKVFNHHLRNLKKPQHDIYIGECIIHEGRVHYPSPGDTSRHPECKSVSCVFVRKGMGFHPDGLLRLLLERQLAFDSMASMPSGSVSLEDHNQELLAQYHERRRLAEEHLENPLVCADAETLAEAADDVIALLQIDEPSRADMQQLAWSAFEAGKALARIEGRPDPLMTAKLKKAASFVGSTHVSSNLLRIDVQEYINQRGGQIPTAKALIEFKRYETRGRGDNLEVRIPGIEDNEGFISIKAFQMRLNRLGLEKRPRGRPRKS